VEYYQQYFDERGTTAPEPDTFTLNVTNLTYGFGIFLPVSFFLISAQIVYRDKARIESKIIK